MDMFKLWQPERQTKLVGSKLLGIIEHDNEDLSEVTYRPSKVFIYPSNEKLYGNDFDLTPKFKTANYGFDLQKETIPVTKSRKRR